MTSYNLQEGSKSYYGEAGVYERFSQAEDYPGMVTDVLAPVVTGHDVLEVGCGTGKYVSALSGYCRSYLGLDVSPQQLVIANRKSIGSRLVCGSAVALPFESNSFDNVISTWVIGTIRGSERREKAIEEMARVLKSSGSIFLVENDIGGPFEDIRGHTGPDSETVRYHQLLYSHGFEKLTACASHFRFDSLAVAQEIFGSIWGPSAAARITSPVLEHRIAVFRQEKKASR